MSSDIPTRVRIGSQTPRVMRIADVRSMNVLDDEVVISDTYADIDIPLSAASEWCKGINVRGYDRIMLFVDLTIGGGTVGDMSQFAIEVQSGFIQRSSNDADWYNRFASFALREGDTTILTASNSLVLDTAALAPASVVRFFFDLEVTGHFMRFKPSAVGGTLTGSRVEIKAIRDLS